MPSLNKEFLSLLQCNYTDYPVFIETGTLNGETTFALEPHFNTVYTIEYSELYYTKTKNAYTGTKVQFLHGDSSIVFTSLLPTIQENAIFFLDGHWSSGDTGRSAKDCPLLEEITSIHTLFKKSAVIIVDDCRLFGQSPKTGSNEDWGEINIQSILNIIGSRVANIYFLDSTYAKNDRCIIHIHEIN
jgi:hypothetical protein